MVKRTESRTASRLLGLVPAEPYNRSIRTGCGSIHAPNCWGESPPQLAASLAKVSLYPVPERREGKKRKKKKEIKKEIKKGKVEEKVEVLNFEATW